MIHRVQGWGQLAGTPEGGLGRSQSRAAASPRGGGCVQVSQAELVDKHIKTHTGANGGISDLKGMGATVRMTCVSPAPRPLCTQWGWYAGAAPEDGKTQQSRLDLVS